jgi:serine/threonine protein kinase
LVPAAFGALCLGGGAWLLRRRADSADGQPPNSDGGGTPSGASVDPGDSESERPGERGPVDISHNHIPTDPPGIPNVAVEYSELIDRAVLASGDVTISRATVPTDDGGHPVTLFEPDANGTLHREDIESFTSAAELWSKLDDHDHVVTVVDYGSSPLPWLATEHVDAGTLADRVGTMELPQALWTAIAITKGVRHAHRHGVAHRRLTPGTVQFRATPAGTWDWPKVGDWGGAWTTPQSDRTAEAAYAAPEQRDESVVAPDEVTDVYRLGAVFYELFTGQPPFGGSHTEVQRAGMNTEPTHPSKIADLPPALDDLLLTALETDPDDRYDSVVYLRDALGEVFLSTA